MSWSASIERMRRTAAACALAFAAVLYAAAPARAAADGCADLDWPLDTEQAAFSAASIPAVASGATLEPQAAAAFELTLAREGSVDLPVAPSGRSKAEGRELYAGFVTVAGGAGPLIVQVTLADDGWIEVVQGGKALDATAHTGSKNCPGIRKSVHFDVTAGSFAVQVSGVPRDRIKISVRPAE